MAKAKPVAQAAPAPTDGGVPKHLAYITEQEAQYLDEIKQHAAAAAPPAGVPKTYVPKPNGKALPKEKLKKLSGKQETALKKATDGKANKTKKGVKTFYMEGSGSVSNTGVSGSGNSNYGSSYGNAQSAGTSHASAGNYSSTGGDTSSASDRGSGGTGNNSFGGINTSTIHTNDLGSTHDYGPVAGVSPGTSMTTNGMGDRPSLSPLSGLPSAPTGPTGPSYSRGSGVLPMNAYPSTDSPLMQMAKTKYEEATRQPTTGLGDVMPSVTPQERAIAAPARPPDSVYASPQQATSVLSHIAANSPANSNQPSQFPGAGHNDASLPKAVAPPDNFPAANQRGPDFNVANNSPYPTSDQFPAGPTGPSYARGSGVLPVNSYPLSSYPAAPTAPTGPAPTQADTPLSPLATVNPANYLSGLTSDQLAKRAKALSRGPGDVAGVLPGASPLSQTRTISNLASSMTEGGMPITPSQLQNLARTVAGESANQPPLGQTAAANTMINRMALAAENAKKYGYMGGTSPDKLMGQYTATGKVPGIPANSAFKNAVPGTDALGAGIASLAGAVSPLSTFNTTEPAAIRDATHYYNPRQANPSWGNSSFTPLGAHVFGNAEPTAQAVADARAAILGNGTPMAANTNTPGVTPAANFSTTNWNDPTQYTGTEQPPHPPGYTAPPMREPPSLSQPTQPHYTFPSMGGPSPATPPASAAPAAPGMVSALEGYGKNLYNKFTKANQQIQAIGPETAVRLAQLFRGPSNPPPARPPGSGGPSGTGQQFAAEGGTTPPPASPPPTPSYNDPYAGIMPWDHVAFDAIRQAFAAQGQTYTAQQFITQYYNQQRAA